MFLRTKFKNRNLYKKNSNYEKQTIVLIFKRKYICTTKKTLVLRGRFNIKKFNVFLNNNKLSLLTYSVEREDEGID